MDKLEKATRQLGEVFREKWKEIDSGRNGTGYMFWDDRDHCIYVEFFGDYERSDKAKMVSTLINTNEDLCFPYSLRIGFHETEMVARKTMMEWFRADDSEVDESNRTGG